MHIAMSIGYGIHLILWLPCLFVVAGVALQSLFYQIQSDRRADTLWKLQSWSLVSTAVVAIIIHCIGHTQLISAHHANASNDFKDGMKIIRFVDIGYYVILGIGFLLLVATTVVRGNKTHNQKEAQ
jgi:hypothetical protein